MAKYTVDNIKRQSMGLIDEVNKSGKNWSDFLKKSAYLYKYNFLNQLLIVKSNPNATAVGSFELWTKRFNTRIKRGAVGIPILSKENQITYVFDINDTYSNFKIWQFEKPNKFVIDNEIKNNTYDLKINLTDDRINKDKLTALINDSIKLMVYSRTGFKFDSDSFNYIEKLGSAEVETIGNYITRQSRKILNNIEKYTEKEKIQAENIKSNKVYFRYSEDEIAIAKQTNLVDYLTRSGEDLLRVSNSEYTMVAHDSMRISDDKFYWNSQGIGGNALDFLMKYYDMPFQEAVENLLAFNGYVKGHSVPKPIRNEPKLETKEPKPVINPLPNELDNKTNRVFAYLTKTRHISEDIVNQLIKDGKIAQDIKDWNDLLSSVRLSDKTIDAKAENDKLKSQELFMFQEQQLPEAFNNLDFNKSIHQSNNIVNTKTVTKNKDLMTKTEGISINKNAEKVVENHLNYKQGDYILSDNDVYKITSISDKTIAINDIKLPLTSDNSIVFSDWQDMFKAETDNGKFKHISANESLESITFYRLGDFFEAFGADAIKISDILKLHTLYKTIDDKEVEMVGVPYHILVDYSAKLNQSGISVNIDNYDKFVQEMKEPNKKENSAQIEQNFETEQGSADVINKVIDADIEKFSDKPQLSNRTVSMPSDNFSLSFVNDKNDKFQDTVKSFAEQVDEVINGTFSRYSDLKVCDTPDILLQVGCEQLPIFYTQRHLRDALKEKGYTGESIHHHGLSLEQLYDIPNQLANPVMIYDSLSSNNSIVVVTDKLDNDNLPIIAVIKPNGTAKYDFEIVDSNFMVSVYGRNNFENQINRALEDNKILYCNKEKSRVLFSVLGLQLSKGFNSFDFNIIIHQSNNIVNTKTVTKNEDLMTKTEGVSINKNAGKVVENHLNYKQGDYILSDNDILAIYTNDNENIAIAKYPNEYVNLYGYDVHTGTFTSEARYFKTFEDAENILYKHRPSAIKNIELTREVNPDLKETMTFNKNSAQIEQNFETEHPGELSKSENITLEDYNKTTVKAKNYHITDNELGMGGAKAKFTDNINSIKTLKLIESENRQATSQEQEILAKYVGWGGLQDAFDNRKDNWSNEYTELKALLTDAEYNAARSSVLNAHFTSPIVINAMYKAIVNLGFENGKILEPSMGIGNFFGMLPESMSKSRLYGVELDSITGRIAKQLYPNANIQIKGFEKTSFTSNTFDIAIGNVPFGNYRLRDTDFRDGDLIHDFFFKKSLDKIHPGGIIAFITSKGTLDKQDNSVRKYLAERADLLGAIRLPNDAFKKNAGTEVTSDILFLQKKNKIVTLTEENMPEWVTVSPFGENGTYINDYFKNHPEMVCGTLEEVTGQYGYEVTCKPFYLPLAEQLKNALRNIKGTYEPAIDDIQVENEFNDMPDVNVDNYRNFCYAVIDGDIYYRVNENMEKQQFEGKKAERIKGMILISESLRELITAQKENYTDENIKALQVKLNTLYDNFIKKNGLLSNKLNKSLFRQDDTSALLLSLENLNDKGELESKADIFTKRTIVPYVPIESVDTASEALAVSISEKAGVDLDYMSQLCSKTRDEIIEDLKGVIFENPETGKFENADEYLSGNVRNKLAVARKYAQNDSKYAVNVTSLEEVQPADLKPSEISAQLGSTWIPVHYFQQFMYELLETPQRCREDYIWRDESKNPFTNGRNGDGQTVIVDYDSSTATYGISNKSSSRADGWNIKATQTYGTERMNAYRIIEETLNLKPVKVMDYVELDGKKRAVINEKETLLAQQKQNEIKQKFSEWIFDDYERTQDLVHIYNEKFNSERPREYDGKHITFGGINPEIKLREHQVNAIAHTLYGGNTLLAHSVGAGKTFEIVASAMESKRLGLCSKSMIVVPKHIVNQFAAELLQLYPTANILVPNEKDFLKDNRERFCSRIATGNYDAIILSHTQLEKIPLSAKKQIEYVQGEIDEIIESIENLKAKGGERGFTVKQMESTKRNLEARLEVLNNDEKRDSTITFEELGIDKLYIDEAHLFKNKYFNTKMGRNVAGINASSASQRAEDLNMKCRYLDEKTDSRGVVFATGTPISNSMTEMYIMQNYLQHDRLVQQGLNHFDAWASTFGETQLSLELAPEGKGYLMKTRFSKFFNLPELMNMFRDMADIKTAETLNLPVPKANFHTVVTEASEFQKEMVDDLADRAKAIRDKKVDSSVDNMLKVTNDGRQLALDQRLMNDMLPDDENSKVNTCIRNTFEIWNNTADTKSTQMIFCDLSTPHYDDSFNVYDDIKTKLIDKGIPVNEIAFIHDCKTDEQKQKLFTKVKNGDVRILLGSTGKMGTGTNCQDRLIALHHLDCPWRPSDLEQRNGRIIRQGNTNPNVDIYNYVTKDTFDAFLYQTVETKQKFISQVMTEKSPARSAEDIDETVLSYAQIKALATGNPKIKEKMDLEIDVNRLRTVFSGYQDSKRRLQADISKNYPEKIQRLTVLLKDLKADKVVADNSKSDEFNGMTVKNIHYTDKKDAGTALIGACQKVKAGEKNIPVGEYRGFNLSVSYDTFSNQYILIIKGNLSHNIDLSNDAFGNIIRIDNALNSIEKKISTSITALEETKNRLEVAKIEVEKPFPLLKELREKENRLDTLNRELSVDMSDTSDSIHSEQEYGIDSVFEAAEYEADLCNKELMECNNTREGISK